MSARGETAIAGFYEIPTEKEMPGRSTYSVLAEVARGAIADAGLRPKDIDGLVGQEGLNSMTLAEVLGLKPRYTASMSTHGASGATSITTATMAITTGLADYVLCIFGESRVRSSSRVTATAAARPTDAPGTRGSEWEAPFGPVIAQNGGYGMMKQRHMFEYGTKQEQFAKMAVDQRTNALDNPNAVWKGQPITIQDVLDSRFTNEPLHLLESVMPCSGGAAVIVTSAERARAMPHSPVYVLGVGGPATSHDAIWQEENIATTPVVMTAPTALRMAEYNINDMQFAEFYDCYTILAMACLEDAGFCEKGEIGAFYGSTDTTYEGEFPVNTDGGQISAGQPGGSAGGFRHVVEATRQVMGRAESRQVEKSDLCMVNG